MSDIFVIKPFIHTIFRALAAFIVAPILIYKGYVSHDFLILFIGIMTLIIDTSTFVISIIKMRGKKTNVRFC